MNPISIPIPELKPALAGLGKVISRRTTLPVLDHVRIERTSNGRIELAATDLAISAVALLDTPCPGEPVLFLVPFDELNRTVKNCGPGEALSLEPVEKDRLTLTVPIRGQSIEHRCDSIPSAEFPPIPEFRGEPALLDAAVPQAIQEAQQCSSTDETRLILNGAFLDVSQPGAHYIVGTDGRHLFSANSFSLPLTESLVLPNDRFLGWKEFSHDGPWKLRVAESEKEEVTRFDISTTHWRFIGPSVEGTYPNWRQVVPDGSATSATLTIDSSAAGELVQTITRLPELDRINQGLGLELTHRRAALLVPSEDGVRTRLEIEGAKVQGNEVTVFLNRHLLAKALRFGLLQLEIIDALSPVRFHAGGRQLVVMPIRPGPAPGPVKTTAPPASTPAATNPKPPPTPAEPSQEDTTMPANNGAAHGASTRTESAASEPKPALETALAQIETIKGHHREAVRGLTDLADLLKQASRESKATEKEISSVRQTLRQIQAVRI